jgi:hypothetical protein
MPFSARRSYGVAHRRLADSAHQPSVARLQDAGLVPRCGRATAPPTTHEPPPRHPPPPGSSTGALPSPGPLPGHPPGVIHRVPKRPPRFVNSVHRWTWRAGCTRPYSKGTTCWTPGARAGSSRTPSSRRRRRRGPDAAGRAGGGGRRRTRAPPPTAGSNLKPSPWSVGAPADNHRRGTKVPSNARRVPHPGWVHRHSPAAPPRRCARSAASRVSSARSAAAARSAAPPSRAPPRECASACTRRRCRDPRPGK